MTKYKTSAKHRAFTLIELMIVVAVIAILASFSMVVVQHAQHSARVAATESTIRKIDEALMEIYEKYQDRRVDGATPEDRLQNLYELMMVEMPISSAEIELNDPLVPHSSYSNVIKNNPLRQIYHNLYQRAMTKDAAEVGNGFQAKCLYMIIANANPEARELFTMKEIAEDSDGLPYFVDSWGEPIVFIRWAPAFIDSNRQPNVLVSGDDNRNWVSPTSASVPGSPPVPPATDTVGLRMQDAIDRYSDPLDPLQARERIGGVPPTYGKSGWLLFPLVVSSGPDREFGMACKMEVGVAPNKIPIAVPDPFIHPLGAPVVDPVAVPPVDGTQYYYDNITNHGLGRR